MRITSAGAINDCDRENLQLQCNVCKNDTHNPNLKRKGESFSISF